MVTPSANRNTYSIAIFFYILTQGRGASPLNPGLWNRNSYRVAKVPLPIPLQGAGAHTCCVLGCLNGSFPLGKVGMGSQLAGTHPWQYFPHCYTLLYIYQDGVLCPQTWTWETLPYNLTATHYTTAVTFGSESPLLTTISNTASISVLLKAISLRAGIGSRMVLMTQKIVEEKCIDITIMLKCRENDDEL